MPSESYGPTNNDLSLPEISRSKPSRFSNLTKSWTQERCQNAIGFDSEKPYSIQEAGGSTSYLDSRQHRDVRHPKLFNYYSSIKKLQEDTNKINGKRLMQYLKSNEGRLKLSQKLYQKKKLEEQ